MWDDWATLKTTIISPRQLELQVREQKETEQVSTFYNIALDWCPGVYHLLAL